jgi:hypothetical protein
MCSSPRQVVISSPPFGQPWLGQRECLPGPAHKAHPSNKGLMPKLPGPRFSSTPRSAVPNVGIGLSQTFPFRSVSRSKAAMEERHLGLAVAGVLAALGSGLIPAAAAQANQVPEGPGGTPAGREGVDAVRATQGRRVAEADLSLSQ